MIVPTFTDPGLTRTIDATLSPHQYKLRMDDCGENC